MLPCNISSGPASDSVYLVLWYRKDSGTPIYSYDSRTGDPGNPGLWSEPEAFGERAFFRVGESPAVLAISNLTKEDGGIYTCRSEQYLTYISITTLFTISATESNARHL